MRKAASCPQGAYSLMGRQTYKHEVKRASSRTGYEQSLETPGRTSAKPQEGSSIGAEP